MTARAHRPPRRLPLHRLVLGAGLALVGTTLFVGSAAPAGAHPLGNFTINHSVGLHLSPTVIRVDYVLDLAEIPAFQERTSVDADSDGDVSPAEAGGYATTTCTSLAGSLSLAADGRPVPLTVSRQALSFPPGQGGLDTQRLECAFDGAVSLGRGAHSLTANDGAYADRIGWREMTAAGTGVTLAPGLPTGSPTARLTDYSRNASGTVLRQQHAELTFDVTDPDAAAAPLPGSDPTVVVRDRRAADPLTGLMARADEGAVAALAALGVAAALGALHGLAPGHGKTVVAAYLVGSRGSRRQAVGLAGAVALSHTAGVFVLGGLSLLASAAFPLERVYAGLQLVSALLILALGVVLARRLYRSGAWRRRRAHVSPPRPTRLVSLGAAVAVPVHHDHHDHHHIDARGHDGHTHTHGDHTHTHEHHRNDGHAHDHVTHTHEHDGPEHHAPEPDAPEEQAPEPDGHEHDAPEHHAPEHHAPEHHAPEPDAPEPGAPEDQAPEPDGHVHHGHEHDGHPHHAPHGHGILGHRHRVDWGSLDLSGPMGWRALVALGLSGGMVPSASAVIVLLGAVQLGQVPFGAALILAFGIGLSAALVSVGLGVVAITRRTRRHLDTNRLAERLTPMIAPGATLALLVVGLWLTARALGRL